MAPPVIGAVGKVVVDHVILCAEAPAPDQHQNVTRLVTAGGASANVTANLAAHGRPTVLAGWAGEDPLSRQVTADLADAGVNLRLRHRGQAPHATIVAWGGDRAFLVDQGDLRADAADVADSWLDGLEVVHFNGFELLSYCWPGVLAEVAARARARGIAVSVDCPTANRMEADGAEAFVDAVVALRPNLVFCNRAEASVVSLDVLPRPPGMMVVHDGTAPTTVMKQGSVPTTHAVRRVVPNAETTGCGDAFAAGFLAEWAAGATVRTAVATAHEWAAEQAEVPGAQPRFTH